MDGRPTPIHVGGIKCPGYRSGSSPAAAKPFQTIVSYVNPNARCPVCGDRVYFYQSPNGGRVFFNDLGWPWKKHPCTDNPKSQTGAVKRIATVSGNTAFRNRDGEALDLYELWSLTEKDNIVNMRFSRIGENRSFQASVSIGELRGWDVTVRDLRHAPSFAVRTKGNYRIIEFISGRKKMIDRIVVRKPKPLRSSES
jgi:hypothetical protein